VKTKEQGPLSVLHQKLKQELDAQSRWRRSADDGGAPQSLNSCSSSSGQNSSSRNACSDINASGRQSLAGDARHQKKVKFRSSFRLPSALHRLDQHFWLHWDSKLDESVLLNIASKPAGREELEQMSVLSTEAPSEGVHSSLSSWERDISNTLHCVRQGSDFHRDL
jgi:hypothetical protein